MRRRSVALLLALLWIGHAAAQASPATERASIFYFAAGWRDEAKAENVVELGAVYACATGWCADLETFSGHANLPLQPLPERHEMHTPEGKRRCADGPLNTVQGSRARHRSAKVSVTEGGLRWEIDGRAYEWLRDTSPAGGFVLNTIDKPGGATPLDQTVGFAYEADESASRQSSLSELNGAFDGEIQHKDALAAVSDAWKPKGSSLDFRKFMQSTTGSAVRGYAAPGHPDVERRIGKRLWVQHSLLLLAPQSPTLRYVLHDYGHDFDGDSCFDEQGHNKLMLPVRSRQQTRALVYIEYTQDKRDGVPMISVGRYFRR